MCKGTLREKLFSGNVLLHSLWCKNNYQIRSIKYEIYIIF